MLKKYVLIVAIASLTMANTAINAGTLGKLVGIEIPNELDVKINSTEDMGSSSIGEIKKGQLYKASELGNFFFIIPYRGWDSGSGKGQIHLQVFVRGKDAGNTALSTATLWDEASAIILTQGKSPAVAFSKNGKYDCQSCAGCKCNSWNYDREVDVAIILKIDNQGEISFSDKSKRANWGDHKDGEDPCPLSSACRYEVR